MKTVEQNFYFVSLSSISVFNFMQYMYWKDEAKPVSLKRVYQIYEMTVSAVPM